MNDDHKSFYKKSDVDEETTDRNIHISISPWTLFVVMVLALVLAIR